MNYTSYRLEFFNGVRFGHGNLDSTDISFHADTLFSALYQEALKLNKENLFLEFVENDRLLFSDGFTYIGKEDFPLDQMDLLHNLGKSGMRVSVGISGNEDPEPYRVNAFYFNDGNGLYIIVGFQDEKVKNLFEELLESLSYTGVGGKKSTGLGRFEYQESEISTNLEKKLQKAGKINILLSTAMAADMELEKILDCAYYSLLKRGGFIDSEKYAEQQMRKQERYVFIPGSCFQQVFKGTVITEKNRGTHPIFRYEKALFLGVDI